MTLPKLALWFVLAVPAGLGAAQGSDEQRPRDAAEAVQEGDVSQWLKYYQREREVQTPVQQPAPIPQPAESKGKDAATTR